MLFGSKRTQILIGPNDWEDFKNGKESIHRYRNQNLPPKCCTGLYELGVAVIGEDQSRKLDRDNVLAVYIGQSVNVRSRLQDYGRCGGHFPPGLFEDVFSKGGMIVYRWVPVLSLSYLLTSAEYTTLILTHVIVSLLYCDLSDGV